MSKLSILVTMALMLSAFKGHACFLTRWDLDSSSIGSPYDAARVNIYSGGTIERVYSLPQNEFVVLKLSKSKVDSPEATLNAIRIDMDIFDGDKKIDSISTTNPPHSFFNRTFRGKDQIKYSIECGT